MHVPLMLSRRLLKRLHVRFFRFLFKFNLTEQHFLIGLAIVVGIGGGFGSVVFRKLVEAMRELLLLHGRSLLGSPNLLPVIPMLGGLAAGLLIYFYAREAKGHGVPEVMDAIITKGGIIRPRVVVVKALASAFTLGSGGSAGSEGPIIQIGSAWGSSVGQTLKLSEVSIKTLNACGAAAGISAIFNAPIAGVLFALEIILGDFTIAAFTPVVISSVFSAVVAHAYFGDRPVFTVPDYHFFGTYELGWFIVLAVLSGFFGVIFIKALYACEDFCDGALNYLPEWLIPALGGALVGVIGLAYPEVMGVGYRTIGAALHNRMDIALLGILLVLKLLATSFTLGSGGSGGIFAPSLFFGATLGGAFGNLAYTFLPGVNNLPEIYAIAGMGAAVAATTHAPLTAMLIIFEMTGSYHLILPLMFSTILAVFVARLLERESIYTLKLVRRGIRVYRGRDLSVLEKIPVSQAMSTDYGFVQEHTSFGEIVNMIQQNILHDFPVLDENDRLSGMVWFHDIREVLLEDTMRSLVIASEVSSDPPSPLTPRSSLADALVQFSIYDADNLPVIQSEADNRLVGIVTRADLMRRYERELLLRKRS